MTKTYIEELLEEKQELDAFYKEQKKLFDEKVKDCIARRNELSKLCWKYFIDNKLYCPMSVLEQYKGEKIEEITLVFDNGGIELYSYGDIIKVDKEGHFYYSDESHGIVEYNKDTQRYVQYRYGLAAGLNVVGFYDLALKDGGTVVKTQYKELLQTTKKSKNLMI